MAVIEVLCLSIAFIYANARCLWGLIKLISGNEIVKQIISGSDRPVIFHPGIFETLNSLKRWVYHSLSQMRKALSSKKRSFTAINSRNLQRECLRQRCFARYAVECSRLFDCNCLRSVLESELYDANFNKTWINYIQQPLTWLPSCKVK